MTANPFIPYPHPKTCVLCNSCFNDSNHEGHDVLFYHAQAGGCCDCGDADAWDPSGFCSRHGKSSSSDAIPRSVVDKARDTVAEMATWITRTSELAKKAYERFISLTDIDYDDTDGSINWYTGEIDLAKIGRAENGLYIVLHKSEVVDPKVLLRALVEFGIPPRKADDVVSMLTKKVNGGTNNAWTGEVVIYGPDELLCDLTPNYYLQYLTSPTPGSDRVVNRNYHRLCNVLRRRGLCVSVKTYEQLRREQRASACISWIHAIANAADVLCEQGEGRRGGEG